MVLPPVQEDRFYTIACWAHGKKNPIVNALEVLVWVFLTMDLSSQISLRAHCEQPLVVSIVHLTVTKSYLLLVPAAKSRVVVWTISNSSNYLFTGMDGRLMDDLERGRSTLWRRGGRRCTGFKAIQVEIVNIGTRQLFDPCVGLVTAFGKFTRYMPTLIAQCSSSAGHVCTTHWSS